MAYKLKPNYHFENTSSLGLDKVPVGRFVIVEDVGPNNEIVWYKKVSQDLRDVEGVVIGTLDETHTINDALTYNCIISPLDLKVNRDEVYTITEIDSMLTLKADAATTYSKNDVDSTFRTITDSYSVAQVDAIINETSKNPTGIIQQSNLIDTNTEIEYGNNAASFGPITINDNVEVLVNDESEWQII